MKWTEEQLRIINGRGKNLLVSASAGSGKTTVMIERIISLLQDGYRIEDFLVSTFTKASAADMKHKLMARLRESGDPVLISQIKSLPDADITNLDSFCKKLITRYFYAAGIDPDFELMNENEARGALNASLDEVMREYSASGDGEFSELRDFMTVNRRDDRFRACVKDVYYYAVLRPEPEQFLTELCEKNYEEFIADKKRVREERLISRITSYALECKEVGFTRNEEGARLLIERIRSNNPDLPVLRGRVGDFERLNAVYKELREEAEALFEPTEGYGPSHRHLKKIIEIALRLKAVYDAKKKRSSRLDFSDLEHLAYAVLIQPEIAEETGKRYKFVFVDEYQDINPLQEKIISLITASKFMVGDLKQSIYAFRGCRPEIFAERALEYGTGEGGELVSLNVNYRCGERIVAFVNAVFDAAMTKENSGVDYAVEAHMVAKSGREGFTPGVVLYESSAKEEEGLYDVERGELDCPEAEGVANRISQLVAGIEENGVRRSFGFGEIAVLTRSTGREIIALTQKLRARGIPYYLSRKTRFTTIKEVRMLISCLRLIDNNKDEIALAGAMLSHAGGFTPAQLIRLKGERKSLWEAVFEAAPQREEGELRTKTERFLSKLNRYNALSVATSVDELAGRIIEENDFFLHAFSEGGDAEGLDEFLNYICESPLKESLHGFLTELEESEPDYVANGGGDAVKIMTIHGSKGLEFPAVILMNAGKEYNLTDSSQPIIMQDGRIAIKGFDGIGGREYKTDLYATLLEDKIKSERAEELRLLYVALTRAREFLEVYASGNRGYMKLFEPILDRYARPPQPERRAPKRELIPPFTPNEALTERIKKRIAFSLPQSNAPQKTYVTKLTATDKPVFASGLTSSEVATLRGTAYHSAMEGLDFEDVEGSYGRLPQNIREVVDKRKIVEAAKVIKPLIQGKALYREQAFILPVNAEEYGFEGGKTLVQGVIDLMAVGNGECIIVDYKTGSESYAFSESNVRQIKLYKRAAEEILGITAQAYIFSFDTCAVRRVE